MTAVYEIVHDSRYWFATPARHTVMSLCLQPNEDSGQCLLDFAIDTDPFAPLYATRDAFGNSRHLLTLHRSLDELRIISRSLVRIETPPSLPNSLGCGAWDTLRGWRDSFDLWDSLRPSELTGSSTLLSEFVRTHDLVPGDDPLDDLRRLTSLLHDVFKYTPGATTVESTIDHILETGAGVCQDYAHVMIAIARCWGVPSRYRMGYLHVTGAEGEQAPQNATHAWVECLLPNLGWVGFDPTNRTLTDERHVTVAAGRDFHDVSPARGVYQGCGEMTLEVDVRMRIEEGRANGS